MGRRIFNFAAMLSLAMCVVTVELWYFSYGDRAPYFRWDANPSYVLGVSDGGISIIRICATGEGQAHAYKTDSSYDGFGLHFQTYSLDGIGYRGKERRVNISMWWPLCLFSPLALVLILNRLVLNAARGGSVCAVWRFSLKAIPGAYAPHAGGRDGAGAPERRGKGAKTAKKWGEVLTL